MNGPIINITVMPGAQMNGYVKEQHNHFGTVQRTESAEKVEEETDERQQDIINKLTPLFFGIEEDAKDFLARIHGMKPTQITQLVNRLVTEKKISELSCHRPLWKVLHDAGIYTPSESNWNMQVK